MCGVATTVFWPVVTFLWSEEALLSVKVWVLVRLCLLSFITKI